MPLTLPSRPHFLLALGLSLGAGVALAAWALAGNPSAAGAEHLSDLVAADRVDPADGAPDPSSPALLPSGGPRLDRVLDELDASAQQRAQTHQILAAAALPDLDRVAMVADQAELARLYAVPVLDVAALRAVHQRLQERRLLGERRHLQALLDVAQVLGPEQRERLARRYQIPPPQLSRP